MSERWRGFRFRIDDAPSGHAAKETAHELCGMRVEIAHDGEDRHQASAPIPAPQRATQTAAGDGALTQWIETAVAIVGARRRWHRSTALAMTSDSIARATRATSRWVRSSRQNDAQKPTNHINQSRANAFSLVTRCLVSGGRGGLRMVARVCGWCEGCRIDWCEIARGALIARWILGAGWWDRLAHAFLRS
ncbi:MAG: hypothetical protein ABL932_07875 [Terricaulis sp.]